MGRTLDDEFEDEGDAPPRLELDTGTAAATGPGSGSTRYGGGAMEFDDDPLAEEGSGSAAFELDLPAGSGFAVRAAPAPPPPTISDDQGTSGVVATTAPSQDAPHAADASITPAAPSEAAAASVRQRPTAAAVIANYPPVPVKVRDAPKYTLQIMIRQMELRSELVSLRRRRSPDVPLYESALRAYEPAMFHLGAAVSVSILVGVLLLVCLPLIVRVLGAA